MPIRISEMISLMYVERCYVNKNTGGWALPSPCFNLLSATSTSPVESLEELLQAYNGLPDNYLLAPVLKQSEFERGFIAQIKPFMEDREMCYGFENYLREHFNTSPDAPYIMDVSIDDYPREFHWMLYEFDGLFDEYILYKRKEFTRISVNWCKENGIAYALD